jgi:hypothetical protein
MSSSGIENPSSYLTGDTLRLRYRDEPVNAMKVLNVFTAVTMKNVVFWDIKTQFVLHRKHINSSLQRSAGYCYERFEVFTAVTMKNAVFWDIETKFLPQRRHITSTLQIPAG